MVKRPTWAEISLGTLRRNYHIIEDYVAPNAKVCCVVKCFAYGHGTVQCATALAGEGAEWFGVTGTEEGIALRESGIKGNILLLTGFWQGEEEAVIQYDLTAAVWDVQHIDLLEKIANKMERKIIPVHLEVDTGMARLGISLADLSSMLRRLSQSQNVYLEGVFSHFASAEAIDGPDGEAQLNNFEDAVQQILDSGMSPKYLHMANSAALATRPRSLKNLVRPGLSLYGYSLPYRSVMSKVPDSSLELPVLPILSWKTRIIALRDLPANRPVGYSAAYITRRLSRIAVMPVGYGDGLSRQLSNRGRLILRDHYIPIIGNISMDLTLADVTDVPGAEIGDEVTIIGSTPNCSINAWEHASHSMTIPYEVLCGISQRVTRIFLE